MLASPLPYAPPRAPSRASATLPQTPEPAAAAQEPVGTQSACAALGAGPKPAEAEAAEIKRPKTDAAAERNAAAEPRAATEPHAAVAAPPAPEPNAAAAEAGRIETLLRRCGGPVAQALIGMDLNERALAAQVRLDLNERFRTVLGSDPTTTTALYLPGDAPDALPQALIVERGDVVLVLTPEAAFGAPQTPALEALMERIWGLGSLAPLEHPERMGARQLRGLRDAMFCDGFALSDELFGPGRGIGKVERLERSDALVALFKSNPDHQDVPEGEVRLFKLFSQESASNFMPSTLLAAHMATGKFYALSRQAIGISGKLLDPAPRAAARDALVDVLAVKVLAEAWSIDAYRPYMNAHLALLENKSTLLRVRHGADLDEPAFSTSTLKDAKTFLGIIPMWARNKEGRLHKVNLVNHWLKNEVPRMVERIFFDPSKPPMLHGKGFNLFRGRACEPREPRVRGRPCPGVMELFGDVYCPGNQKHLDFLLDCLALKLQRPGKKLGICIVLRGCVY